MNMFYVFGQGDKVEGTLFPLEGNQKLGPLDLNHQSESTFTGPARAIQPLGMTQVVTLLLLKIPTHYNKEYFLRERLQIHVNFLFFILISHIKKRLYLLHWPVPTPDLLVKCVHF